MLPAMQVLLHVLYRLARQAVRWQTSHTPGACWQMFCTPCVACRVRRHFALLAHAGRRLALLASAGRRLALLARPIGHLAPLAAMQAACEVTRRRCSIARQAH
jgi:hypothetical protein